MEYSIYNAKFSWFRSKGMEIEISWLIENRTFNEDKGGGGIRGRDKDFAQKQCFNLY